MNTYDSPKLIDHSSDRPLYKQLADLIRAQIQTGEFAPGQRLPAQKSYIQAHGLSRHTVDRAMVLLCNEGLIVVERHGTRVRRPPTRLILSRSQGKVIARLPTEPERRAHRISEGVPILIIKHNGQDDEIYPADEVEIHIIPNQTLSAERGQPAGNVPRDGAASGK